MDRNSVESVNNYWRNSRDISKTAGARLEDMLTAFQMMMQEVITDHDSVQRFWESTNLLALILAAADDAAIDSGATIRKDSLIKYQALHLSFRKWLATPVTAELPTGQIVDGVPERVEVTFAETPTQLIVNSPVKVTPA